MLTALGVTLLTAASTSGQARLVINNNAWVRIDNGAWVVVENPTPTGVQTMGTGGNLRSEGEFNRLRWQIRNNTGTYVVPFTAASGVKMPLTYTALVGGSAEPTASICFSTFNHASAGIGLANAWNNDLYRPTDVTHMNSFNAPSVPNSQNAVDRFWIIDPGVPGYTYSALPSIALNFTYDPTAFVGEVTAGNTIGPLDPVGAQRFNNAAGIWGDYLPAGGFVPGTPSSVIGAVAAPADFFRSWTLANILEPLPVELLSFDRTCRGAGVLLSWSTATETNSSHFLVERSTDGLDFMPFGSVEAAGNSQVLLHYSFVDVDAKGLVYHRLMQVDIDGTWSLSPMVAGTCSMVGATELVNAWDDGAALNLLINSHHDQDAHITLFDASGKLIVHRGTVLMTGQNYIALPGAGLADGIYLVRLVTTSGQVARRVNVLE